MEKNEEILNMIIGFIEKHGYPPTVEEIGIAVGYRSKCTTWFHLQQMLDAGIIETDNPSSPRAIRVPGYVFMKKADITETSTNRNT